MQRPTESLVIIDCLKKKLWKRLGNYVRTGYDIDTDLQSNKSALCFAVETGNINAVEHILRFKPNIESFSNRNSIIHVLNLDEISSAKITRRLFEYGFKFSTEHLKNYELLHKAFDKRNEEFIEVFLKNTDILDVVANCNFFLHSAIEKQMWKVSKQLIKSGFNINLVDANGRTPLINCLSVPYFSKTEPFISDHQKLIKILLEHPDIDLTVIDNDGRSALNYVFYGNVFADTKEETRIEIIKLFLRKGVNINAQNGEAVPFLHDVVLSNSAKIVQFLLMCNANVNAIDKYGQTAFHVSLSNYFHSEITGMFLEHELNLNSRNEYGQSLLYTASSSRNEKGLQFLLEKNVDINEIQNNSETALHAICDGISNPDLACFQLLMKYKPKVNHINKDGCTPLHYAADGSCPEATRILLHNGAKVNIENNNGETPLHNAVSRRRYDNVQALLEHGAKVNFPDGKCCAPLVYAIQLDCIEIVIYLLKSGADPNTRDSFGMTVLQIACKNGVLDVAEQLLLYGADFNLTDEDGLTPLSSFLKSPKDSFDEYNNYYYYNNDEVALLLYDHIMKMKAVGFHVIKKNLDALEKVYHDFIGGDDNWEDFSLDNEELKDLKKKIIGTNFSYFDIIVLSINEIETYMKNRSIRKEISLLLDDDECGIYTDLINTKIVQAEFRHDLLDTSFKILCGIFQDVPLICIEKMLSYLDINDLRVLNQSCKLTIS